jgi:hypothetical protein
MSVDGPLTLQNSPRKRTTLIGSLVPIRDVQ